MSSFEPAQWIAQVAKQMGTDVVSQQTYGRHRPSEAPSPRTLIREYGTWWAACEAAGVDAAEEPPVPWTTDALLHALVVAEKETEGPLTPAEYRRWRADQPDPREWPTASVFTRYEPPQGVPDGTQPWVAWCEAAGVAPAYKQRRLVFADGDLIKALREAYEAVGGGLTEHLYQQWAAKQPEAAPVPHSRTMAFRFGTWRNAMEAANLPPVVGRLMSAEDAVRAAIKAHPDGLTANLYREWAKRDSGRPSLSTVTREYGTWSSALEANEGAPHRN